MLQTISPVEEGMLFFAQKATYIMKVAPYMSVYMSVTQRKREVER